MTAKKLKIHIVSDVHLNSNPYDRQLYEENPEKKRFRKFLAALNSKLKPDDQTILILNGDILDVTGSWYQSRLPWDINTSEVEAILKTVVNEILENNIAIITELNQFLKHPLAKIVYVIGNHDNLIGQYTAAQKIITQSLLGKQASGEEKISFVDSFEYPDLGLYVEHGHRFDPLNISHSSQPCFGDVISILVVNHSVALILDRLKECGYSNNLIDRVKSDLYDIEYLRPLSLLPFWIESVASNYRNHPESEGKSESIQDIFRKVILGFHKNPWAVKYLSKQLHLPKYLLVFFIEMMMRCPGILPALSFLISKLLRRTHSNNFQSKMAQKLHLEKGYRMIVFGHTHIPIVTTLSATGRYANTGSWTPVITLLKYSENKSTSIEYLTAKSDFNKIAHSGTLKIELDLSSPQARPKFLLKTVQTGFE